MLFSSKCSSTCESDGDVALSGIISTMEKGKPRTGNSAEFMKMYVELGGVELKRRGLLMKIKDHFGESIVVLQSLGIATMIVFKDSAPDLIKLINITDGGESLESALKTVADCILNEARNLGTNHSK
ncbi:hypothetical protein ACF0H5_015458 [Mactra antiquata]